MSMILMCAITTFKVLRERNDSLPSIVFQKSGPTKFLIFQCERHCNTYRKQAYIAHSDWPRLNYKRNNRISNREVHVVFHVELKHVITFKACRLKKSLLRHFFFWKILYIRKYQPLPLFSLSILSWDAYFSILDKWTWF